MTNNGILLFAMEGLFSRVIFESLLEQGIRFKGIVLPARSPITQKTMTKNSLNVLDTASIESLATFHRIPLLFVSGKDLQQYRHAINKIKPDIILVACFPYLLPAAVYQYPAKGAYNIHPSLLPAYRGPVPLFWQFYHGDMNSGISIHQIDAGFDTGKIVLQQPAKLDDGVSGTDATQLLATIAADLLQIFFAQVAAGQISAVEQDQHSSSYFSWPGLEQFTIPTSWDVRRAFNFIRGTMHWRQRYKVLLDDKEMMISEALEFSHAACASAYVILNDDQHLIRFSDGSLRVLL